MELLGVGIVLIVVGVISAAVSIWMHGRVMESESFIGEYFGGILWAVLVAVGAGGIVIGGAMLCARFFDGVQTLQQFF